MKTLTGIEVYTNEIWSDPFDITGNITIVGSQLSSNNEVFGKAITIYPNPVDTQLTILLESGNYQVSIYNTRGQLVHEQSIAGNDQIIDNKTQVNHNFPNCKSSQRYKGVLTDQSQASYLSKTFVDKLAQKTEAYQLSKGILLSDNSYFHSKPELKIFADDVKCSHGSTIGPMDRDLLFYLRSRGR